VQTAHFILREDGRVFAVRLHCPEKSHAYRQGNPAGIPHLWKASRGIKRLPGKSRRLHETQLFNLGIAYAKIERPARYVSLSLVDYPGRDAREDRIGFKTHMNGMAMG
jgi:hypothetical protein